MQIGGVSFNYGTNLNTNNSNRANLTKNNLQSNSSDVFVKQNNNAANTISFKGKEITGKAKWEHERYAKKYDNLEELVPEGVFQSAFGRESERYFCDYINFVNVYSLEKHDDHELRKVADPNDNMRARVYIPKKGGATALVYNRATMQLESEIKYQRATDDYGNELKWQVPVQRTDYYEDGVSPEYKMKRDKFDYPNADPTYRIKHFDKQGRLDKRYIVCNGNVPLIITQDVKNGRIKGNTMLTYEREGDKEKWDF